MSLRDHLQQIYDRHGQLTAEQVVREAKRAEHPLHSRFEWDDKIAGHKYRVAQAAELIRSVKVVYREADEDSPAGEVRAWHATREDGRYESVDTIAGDPQAAEVLLRQMELEWKALHRRFGHMAEFVELVRQSVRAAA